MHFKSYKKRFVHEVHSEILLQKYLHSAAQNFKFENLYLIKIKKYV